MVSANENNAYPGTQLHRATAMIKNKHFDKAFILNIMKITSGSKNQYDLPFYFMGQSIKMNFDDKNCTAVAIKDLSGNVNLFSIANINASLTSKHQLTIDGKLYQWVGAYYLSAS